MASPDLTNLPSDVLDKIRALEEELQEGDITVQGFEKKKAKLLAPYRSIPDGTGSIGSNSSERSTSPQPPSYMEQAHLDSQARTAMVQAVLERNRQEIGLAMPMSSRRNTVGNSSHAYPNHSSSSLSEVANTSLQLSPSSPPPTAPKPKKQSRRTAENLPEGVGKGGVSHKIQQLLNTLKRPKKIRRPIEEYFRDDIEENRMLEDPTAPHPVGPVMQPISGVPLESRHDWHRNLEAAIQHHSSTLGKQAAISIVDAHGKSSVVCTYSKLALRAQKVAHFLLNKLGGGKQVQPGDRVALVFKSDEAATFAAAFWGCLFAAVIPVAVHPPITRDDPGGQQIGFLLNSLGITVAITSDLTVKQLPKEEGKDYIIHFKGWPRLTWFSIDHLPKPSKDWTPPPRPSPDTTAYIEFTADKEESVLGVTITRSALLTHCRSLTTACHYREGEVVVCTEDPKRSIGLWHGIMAAAYNGLHIIFVSPSLMNTLPTAWLHMINKHKATSVISSSRAISSSITLAQSKELRDVRLDGVRMMLLDDGANPWSLASSDLFYDAFSSKGLNREALCPCAGSPETLTLSVRRPSPTTPSGRGVMSIAGLSYGVVRVEEPGSITSLTLQDVGIVMPGARVAVVKINGLPSLCKTDEVGDICVQSSACGTSYWGLQGKSTHTFKVQPIDENDRLLQGTYVRSGLLGFVGEGGLLFVCGKMNGLIQIAGRRHNTEDLIATVMAVEPHGFINKGRIAIFSVPILKEERVVVVAEQKPNCTDETAFTWMNSIVPAVESIHGINLYGIVLVSPGRLPKYPNGVVHVHDTRAKFIEGSLHPVNLLMCPYQCINNLPVPKPPPAVSGAAQIMGDLVTGRTVDTGQAFTAAGLGEDRNSTDGPSFQFVADALHWRALNRPEDVLYSQVDSRGHVVKSMTAIQLHKKAERIGACILEKLKLNSGDHAALVYPPGIELVCGIYGCLYVGVVPVVVKPPAPSNLQGSLPGMKMTIELSKSRAILSTHNLIRLLKSKEAGQVMDLRSLPQTLETDDLPKKKLDKIYHPPTPELIAYLDFSISTTGVLSGVKISHVAVLSMCRVHKHCTELYPSRDVALCLDPYSGLGLVLWCFSGIYSGHNTILINPYELEINPMLWLTVLSTMKVRDTYCSYSVVDLCMRELGTSIEQLQSKNINLASLRSCVIISEERPRTLLINSFTTLFNIVGLSARAVTAAFGCRVNSMICFQGPRQPESSCIYVDSRALRLDRVVVLEKGSPHSMCLTESAKMVEGCRLIIVNPETKMPCAHTDIGEIWVTSYHNGSGYYGLKESLNDSLSIEHFKANLTSGADLSVEYARTGYLGFLINSEKPDGGFTQSVYIVGSLDESLNVRGFRYHPVDLEATVIRCHKNVINSAVFTSNKLLVVVAELYGDENEALDIVPVITTSLLEEHQLVAGIVVVTDPGTIPINSRGEKQRIHLRDTFLADEMDPIYVAYNL